MIKGLTITVPEGAVCTLYPNVPAKLGYLKTLEPEKAIPATRITTAEGTTACHYAELDAGIYHCCVDLEGYNSVCQVINYTQEKTAGAVLDIQLDKLAGSGYEAGHMIRNTQEFIDAQFVSHKDAWGLEYAGIFQTPQFFREEGCPGRHQQTTNEELMDFIAKLDAACENMYVFSLGKSPKYGYDMPLVLFTREKVAGMTLEQAAELVRNNGKLTVQYTAQCHSIEPVSCEGALAMMLQLCHDYGNRVLQDVDIYIIPRINPDGAFEVTRVSPTTGEDMNRDYLRTNNQEIRMVIGAYNLFLPEVAIDGHERRHSALCTDTDLCNDFEFQVGAGSLNHPAKMTELAMDMALTALAKGREIGLRGHFYTRLASAAGGSAGSSYFGTRNSLSFLIETPGQIYLGMNFMERRVISQYLPASALIDYTIENAPIIWATVHASRDFMAKKGAIYIKGDGVVLEHDKSETGFLTVPKIHVPSGQVAEPEYRVAYTEHTIALRSRTRPTAYVIPRDLTNEEEILRVMKTHDIPYYKIPKGSIVKLQRYIRKEDAIDLAAERGVLFLQGAWVFPNTVPSTILNVIMEPDFNTASGRKMTLLSMGLVDADENGNLPIYRYCHDLTEGKVALEK